MSNNNQRQTTTWTIDLDSIEFDPEDFKRSVPIKRVPNGDIFEASRAGDVERIRLLLQEGGVNVNARDQWDSVALYYTCLAGHLDAARLLLENGAICAEHTFDGDRCHYAALNLKIRKLLKAFEARPPPLGPLQAALRDTFLACNASTTTFLQDPADTDLSSALSSNDDSKSSHFPPDVTFVVQGRSIEAHRIILSARSPFFKKKFEMDWKDRREVRFSKERLSYPALYSLIHFFYSDRLEVAVDDMEDLVRICKVCKCEELQNILEKEIYHQKYADYKSLGGTEHSQKRFILQGISLPEQYRLPGALNRVLQASLAKSCRKEDLDDFDPFISGNSGTGINQLEEDLADICVKVGQQIYRCHQVILASRSEYFRARFSLMEYFCEGKNEVFSCRLPILEEHDLSTKAFENMIEYMYTDVLKDVDPDQVEELFDAASRYLLFPLKRAVADVLLPHLDMLSPAELCQWLILSDMYGVFKIREYCLDVIACNFETFADTPAFRAMLLTLPPPSGDCSHRTTLPSAPGSGANTDQGNILDDLREKWLEAEAAELDKRDESALEFDKWLEMLMITAKRECSI